jgi:hypothetical protein
MQFMRSYFVRHRVLQGGICSVIATVAFLDGNAAAKTIDSARIVNRPGIVVFRGKPFYSDDLVKSARFSRVEDRTAMDNPDYGYFVFTTSNGELQLPPQAIEGRFFIDVLQFPETLRSSTDLERVTALKNDLQLLSRFNDSIAKALDSHMQRMSEAVTRLQKGDWWEKGTRWVTKEERDRRTALDEKKGIDAAASEVRAGLRVVGDLEALARVIDSIAPIQSLPATTKEVAAHKETTMGQLKSESGERRLALEQDYLNDAHSRLKPSIEMASSIDEILAARAKLGDIANVPLSSPQAVIAREQSSKELLTLIASKERALRISSSLFDSLDGWKRTLDEMRSLSATEDPAQTAASKRSQDLYKRAVQINEKLKQSDSELCAFFAGLPASQILSGEALPSAPSSCDEAVKACETFVVEPGSSSPIAVGELDESAAALKTKLSLYRQLSAVSQRANRKDLWNNLEIFEVVLAQMPSVCRVIGEEKAKYDSFIDEARKHEESKDFADAAGAYQSALDIAPSTGIASKLQSMKDQDLGL